MKKTVAVAAERLKMKAWKHFCTINKHRFLVMKGCFQVGLFWQGLTHDLSKYAPTEFLVGAKYYQGTRSPNAAEREEMGFSQAWMHHKGRNRHHYEYWTDMSPVTRNYEAVPMPRRYLVEMVMDRIAACKTYQAENYTDGAAWEYFEKSRERQLMHEKTKRELEHLLILLRDEGEKKTFAYMKNSVLKGKPFPWEQETD